MTRPIYLDYQSTTPCDPRVVEAMLPYFNGAFGNPHSRTHAYGWHAEEAVESGRRDVARLIHADPRDIVFTSGATESNNLALKGLAQFYGDQKRHIITVVTEHKCVLDTCRHLKLEGFDITYLPVQKDGLVDLDQLKAALRPDTLVVSVMAVNNETGVIQPLADIGQLCRQNGVFFHTDAAQALGKIPLDVDAMNIDLMSVTAHKIYGPIGIGALYVRRKPRVRLAAQINGGGQERGMRSGTLSPALCVGFGIACSIAGEDMLTEAPRLTQLRDSLLQQLTTALPEIYINGSMEHRIPGNLNISFAHVEGEGLMMGIKNLAVSSGSACTSESLEPSYVLHAMGVGPELSHTSIRMGLGRFTTQADIDTAAVALIESVQKLRAMSPLWDMARCGIDISSIQWSGH